MSVVPNSKNTFKPELGKYISQYATSIRYELSLNFEELNNIVAASNFDILIPFQVFNDKILWLNPNVNIGSL